MKKFKCALYFFFFSKYGYKVRIERIFSADVGSFYVPPTPFNYKVLRASFTAVSLNVGGG
jgi:hypothetical protein